MILRTGLEIGQFVKFQHQFGEVDQMIGGHPVAEIRRQKQRGVAVNGNETSEPVFRTLLPRGCSICLTKNRVFQVRQTARALHQPRDGFFIQQFGQQLGNGFGLSRQNKIRRYFAQRLKHKTPQMRARMRQNQLR